MFFLKLPFSSAAACMCRRLFGLRGAAKGGSSGIMPELSAGSREQRGPALQQGAGFSEQHLYDKAASQLSFLLLSRHHFPLSFQGKGGRWFCGFSYEFSVSAYFLSLITP